YVEAQALLVHYGAVAGCSAQDGISGDTFDIRARQTIVAAGPWTDLFLEKALHKPPACKLKRSKGIHIVVPSRTARHALTVAAADTHFFVLPWRGHTILGTTDTAFTGDPDAAGVREPDIAQFFDFMNRHLPTMALRRSEVEHFYAGLRPLVDDGSKDTYGASRRAEIVDHVQTDNLAGLVSVIGGKWTTSRELAEQVTDRILPKLGKSHRPCTTAAARMPGGEIDDFLAFERSVAQEYPELQNIGHLVRQYGRALPAVLRQGAERPGLLQPIATTGDIGAQVIHAVQEEMAQTLEDVILRRTGIGQLGAPSPAELETVSRLMAQQLDWNEARRQAEIEASRGVYRTADGPG
ncbi:MAG: FAD-dependent oxidoreductase, partial [Alphaproteobacteria bacterium]|nr:FAD-dependent oxidoreductase [Alphaproteobacteria bacterium]